MSTYSISVSEPAWENVDDAFLWLSEHSREAAVEWYEGIIVAFQSLERNPRRCAIAPESCEFAQEIRHLIFGRYRILFKISGKFVEILAVRHSARRFLAP